MKKFLIIGLLHVSLLSSLIHAMEDEVSSTMWSHIKKNLFDTMMAVGLTGILPQTAILHYSDHATESWPSPLKNGPLANSKGLGQFAIYKFKQLQNDYSDENLAQLKLDFKQAIDTSCRRLDTKLHQFSERETQRKIDEMCREQGVTTLTPQMMSELCSKASTQKDHALARLGAVVATTVDSSIPEDEVKEVCKDFARK